MNVGFIKGERDGAGATLILDHPSAKLRISITYLLYPGLPLIRKKIDIQNMSKKDIRIEALDIESIKFSKDDGTHTWIMHEYGRQKALGPYVGECYDPVVVAHQFRNRRGIALGNEAPGVMKRTTSFLKPQQLTTGLTHPSQNFGFRKWLAPSEQWESTWVFTALYENSSDPYEVLNTTVSDYVRLHMGTRLSQIPEKPVFIYNTWVPFLHNINDKLIYELADAAAECGIEEFIIDDGWQDSYGDWGIDKKKFPDGLKPVFDYIKSKGMKPGLWISLGAAESKSKVFREHPEWLVRKADGSPISLHADFDKMYGWESYSMCMTTGWYDHIKNVIINLVFAILYNLPITTASINRIRRPANFNRIWNRFRFDRTDFFAAGTNFRSLGDLILPGLILHRNQCLNRDYPFPAHILDHSCGAFCSVR